MDKNNSIINCSKETFIDDKFIQKKESYLYEVLYGDQDKYMKIIFELLRNNLNRVKITYKFAHNSEGFIGESILDKVEMNDTFFTIEINIKSVFGNKYEYLKDLNNEVLVLENDPNNFISYYNQILIDGKVILKEKIYLSEMNVHTFNKNKNEYIWEILPETISFLRYIKSITDKDTIILFVARDCYFLEKLYRKMYPDDDNYKYILCSRKVMYNSKNFDKYLVEIIEGYKDRLWIDIQGSGNSHMEYFMIRNNEVDKKLFLKTNNLTKKFSGTNAKELQEEFDRKYEKSIFQYLPENWRVNPGLKRDNRNFVFYLEALFMAPHNTIIDIDDNLEPVLSDHRDFNSVNREKLMKEYEIITNDISIEKINIFCRPYLFKKIEDIENRYNGLLVFDIDGTINHKNNKNVLKMVELSKEKNIKIILCSTRHNIFTDYEKNEDNHLKNIIEYNGLNNLGYKLDVWFNPHQYSLNKNQRAEYKIDQIKFNIKIYKIDFNNVYFFDDKIKNIDKAKEEGIKNSFLVDSNKGITNKQLNEFELLI